MLPLRALLVAPLLGYVLISLLSCTAEPPALATSTHALDDVESQLADAVELYRRTRAETLRVATDPNERFESRVGSGWLRSAAENGDYGAIFATGDEAFEVEFNRIGGVGQGMPEPGWPARFQRIHDGERGGFDASSCRSCHFVGGPDGGGTITQVALFRGDGRTIDSAVVRDAPHVMGLGYISLVAREIEFDFARRRRFALESAALDGISVRSTLVYDGVDYGAITAHPDGTVDTDEVTGIDPDLRLRPFGHKGRHSELTDLVDEALQAHHGLQTNARLARFADDPETWLGPGSEFDRDDDGVQAEGGPEQSVLLAAYLSMLGIPEIRPPASASMARVWARGWQAFQDIGCAECHRPSVRFRDSNAVIRAPTADWSINLPLDEAGLSPRPTSLDNGPNGPDDQLLGGTQVFAFTDLRRHDMGPELAELRDEVLPDGFIIPGSVWLTRPLWGLADTAPYLHDGRALTVDEAIRWHGGEGESARDAYVAAAPEEQGALRVFLLSLTREPTVLVE